MPPSPQGPPTAGDGPSDRDDPSDRGDRLSDRGTEPSDQGDGLAGPGDDPSDRGGAPSLSGGDRTDQDAAPSPAASEQGRGPDGRSDRRRRGRWAIAAALVLALVGGGAWLVVGDGDGDEDRARPRPVRTLAELRPDRIIERVERLRGLELKRRPKFRIINPAQAKRYAGAKAARESGDVSERDQRISRSLTTLLGLLPPDVDLDELSDRLAGDAFLGFYDGDENTIFIVRRDGVLPIGVETTVAHELVHAIDDQHHGIFRRMRRIAKGDDGDRLTAYLSVLEGNASAVDQEYAKRYRVPTADPAEERRARELAKEVPFGVLLQIGFPYVFGEAFIGAISAGPGGAERRENALGASAPRTTGAILDPSRYDANVGAGDGSTSGDSTTSRDGAAADAGNGGTSSRIRVDARSVLGPRWRVRDDSSFGAADVLVLLSLAEEDSLTGSLVARAWRDGHYQYLRRRADGSSTCKDPCVARDAFVGTVRLAGADDARRFAKAFGDSLVRRRKATGSDDAARDSGVWKVGGGGAAAHVRGDTVSIAYAPDPALALRLAVHATVR